MRPLRPVLALAVVLSLGTTAAAAAPASSATRAADGYFAVACGFSHRNQDDPIFYPGQPGRSHDHTYFGNTSTDADSTPASLRAAGRTTCRLPADTAAYWAPTLFRTGRAIEPLGVVAFYVRRTVDAVDPFPAGLRMIAGNAAARTAQSRHVTYWSCGDPSRQRFATIPTCANGKLPGLAALRLHVTFPNCWDGVHRDSPSHKSHMAYSRAGECPLTHPVELPALSLVVHYPISGGEDLELASGGHHTAHADFVNAWHQRTLAELVDRYLNRAGYEVKRP